MKAGELPRKTARRGTTASRLRGSAVVEMAVITPLLMTVMIGIMEFGWLFMCQETLTTATREACRVAVLQGSTDQEIQDRFMELIQPTGIQVTTGMLTIQHATAEDPAETISVAVPFGKISLLREFSPGDGSIMRASCSMRKEGAI